MLLTILFILFLALAVTCISFKIFGWVLLKILAIGFAALIAIVGGLVLFCSLIGIIII